MKLNMTSAAAAALLLALAAGAWLALDPRRPVQAAPAPAPVGKAADPELMAYAAGAPQLAMIRAQALAAIALPVGDTLSARVVYDEDVTVRMGVGVAGRIVALKAAPGDKVKVGQLLAEIDSPDLGSAVADLAKARADEERKRLVLARARELVPGEAIAGKDWEAAQADYAQARAETARAAQRVQSINPHGQAVQGSTLRLASPVDGVVAERTATPALEVAPGMAAPLFVLTDPRRRWLLLDVPDALLAAIRLGAAVDVESDAYPGEHFKATVTQLGQAVDPNTRRVVVRARLDNAAGKLLPEMFVRAALLQPGASAVRVPNSALVNRGVYTYLFVERAPGQFVRRRVKLLTRGSELSYVGEGVASGEAIVTTGALLLDADMGTRAGGMP